MAQNPTTEEWQVILSALNICQANSTIAETLRASALDLVQSYMGNDIVVETEWNDGPITIREKKWKPSGFN
jgi:hypothetical protein